MPFMDNRHIKTYLNIDEFRRLVFNEYRHEDKWCLQFPLSQETIQIHTLAMGWQKLYDTRGIFIFFGGEHVSVTQKRWTMKEQVCQKGHRQVKKTIGCMDLPHKLYKKKLYSTRCKHTENAISKEFSGACKISRIFMWNHKWIGLYLLMLKLTQPDLVVPLSFNFLCQVTVHSLWPTARRTWLVSRWRVW